MADNRATLETIFKGLAVFLAVFVGMFIFFSSEATHSTIPIGGYVNNTYNNLTEKLDNLNATVTDIREDIFAIKDREGILEKALSSIEGFTAVAKLMGQGLDLGLDTLSIALGGIGLALPSWFLIFILLMATIIVIYAVLKAISGREQI